ncbi:AraC family transcriptional regulator [Planotetraspora thailandica]|uniref:AraC family transcriptional regulator n=1 Tax=Planotetraspora thailandica TaxID=487172 RepID=A0A8J3UYP7_9ACTN|nr:AraC family transcriptional regulator [Planotetraspora thailandica]
MPAAVPPAELADDGRYRERVSLVPGAAVWARTAPASGAPQRVLPDGCMDLIWADGELLVAGPDTETHVTSGDGGARYVGIRFSPGTGPAVLGVPAAELRDLRVPLTDLWPSAQARPAGGLLEAAWETGAGLGAVLEAIARDRLALTQPDPVMTGVAALLRKGSSAGAAARTAGLSERQLHRRCLAAFGYGPKTLGRILRMNRAVDLARSGIPFAAVAATAGYADQAHLAREVRSLTGVPLGVLIR